MNNYKIILASLVALGIGIIYFAINHEWILIRHPLAYDQYQPKHSANTKKECLLSYWHNNEWHHEKITLIWKDNVAYNCKQIINELLSLWYEEHIINKKIVLESAMTSQSGQELFLSFSRNLFDKEESLFTKWMRIESILRTLRNQGTKVTNIRFLVQHQPLRDRHLDFSQSWPIHGFME
jgi:hypothetical protein